VINTTWSCSFESSRERSPVTRASAVSMVINEGHILGPWQVEPRHAMAPTRCPPSHDTQAKVVKGLVSDDLIIHMHARTCRYTQPALKHQPRYVLAFTPIMI